MGILDLCPPNSYILRRWTTGDPLPLDPYPSLEAAKEAALALGHTVEKTPDGMFYIPYCYATDSEGEITFRPVFLTGQPIEKEETPC